MIARVNFTLGDTSYSFTFDEKSDMEALHKAIVLGAPPAKCKLIPKAKVKLQTNKDTEGNIYINAVAVGMVDKELRFAKAKLGQYKSGGYFWHNWKFDEFAEKRSKDNEDPDKEIQSDDINADDVEF